MIIDSSYFTEGIRKVQDATKPASSEGAALSSLKPDAMAVNSLLEGYVRQYQHRFMCGVFSEPVASSIEAYAEDGEDGNEAYDAVLQRIREAMADYVLYWFLRGTGQQASALGMTVFDNKNRNVSAADRQMTLWNDMVDRLRDFSEWARRSSTVPVSVTETFLTKISAQWL